MTNERTRRHMRVTVVALLFLLTAGAAFAESVKVVVDKATIWQTPTGTGGIIEIAPAGTVLDVRGRQGRWLVVESSTDARRVGYILASQTEPVAGSSQPSAGRTAPSGQTASSQSRAAASPVNRPSKPRPFLSAGVVFQLSTSDSDVTDTRTTLLEQETRSTHYGNSWVPGFEIGGGAGIARNLTLGGLFVMRSNTDTATVTAQIPHPIFYGQPRTLEGSFDAKSSETALHIQVGYAFYTSPRFALVFAGGPSFYWLQRDLLDQLSYTEAYPYDSVTFTGATTRSETENTVGGNVQVDGLVGLSKNLFWQTSGRWGFGSVTFDGASGSTKVGQGQISTGIRVTF